MRRLAYITLAFVILLGGAVLVLRESLAGPHPQIPELPAAYWGTLTIAGNPAPTNTQVCGRIEGVDKGCITILEQGEYGGSGGPDPKLIVKSIGDDIHKTVRFFVTPPGTIGGLAEDQFPAVKYRPGDVLQVDLTLVVIPDPVPPTPTPTPTATPTPTPTPTATPTPTPTPTATPTPTPTPTATPTPTPTPTATPKPTPTPTATPTPTPTPTLPTPEEIEALAPGEAAEIIEEVEPGKAADIIEEVATQKAAGIIEEVAPGKAWAIMEEVTTLKVTELVQAMSEGKLVERLPEVSAQKLFEIPVQILFDKLPTAPAEQLAFEEPPKVDPDLPSPIAVQVTPTLAIYTVPETRELVWVTLVGSPTPVDKILAKFTKRVTDVQVKVQELAEKPPEAPEFPALQIVNSIFTIDIENARPGDISAVHFTIFVEKSWLQANNVHKWSIQFNRLDEQLDGWVPFPSKRVREDKERIFYTVVVPGFSVIAITGSIDLPAQIFQVTDLVI